MAQPTAKRRFRISDEVMSGIESHSYSLLTAEVGGMLMGRVEGSVTHIVGFIPALSASAEQVTLTFTHDVWEDILKLAATEFPEEGIVGWYHTHPTFGVFLSDYDLFIQNNFFSAKGHLALVIDPVQGIYGWFAQNKKGVVEVFEEGATKTGPQRALNPVGEPSPGGLRKQTIRTAAVGVSGLLVGLAVGGGVALTQIPPDLSGALESSKAQLADLTADYRLLQQATSDILTDPVLEYRVQSGDTVRSLAERFYEQQYLGRSFILRANGLNSLGSIPEGTTILIPSPSNIGVTPYRPDAVLDKLRSATPGPDETSTTPEMDEGDETGTDQPEPEEAPE